MKKVLLATQMIEKQIAHINHSFDGFPSERQLAESLGLSRDTVRTAVKKLTEQGTLERQKNGRLKIVGSSDGRAAKIIGFLTPINIPSSTDAWKQSIVDTFEDRPIVVRTVSYSHWTDPAIQGALNNFDGLFFVPPDEPIPFWLKEKLSESSCRVAVLFQDESEFGLPSTIPFPANAQRKLLDHLYALGHRHIHCLNTQQDCAIIRGRINVWQRYLKDRDLKGQLISLTEHKPMESAYQLVRAGLPGGTALFCTTAPAAIGANRALMEMGLKVGRDVSVCTVDNEGMARYLWPSLTSLDVPPPLLYVRQFTKWIIGESEWEGDLLVEPEDLPMFIGESTGPAPI